MDRIINTPDEFISYSCASAGVSLKRLLKKNGTRDLKIVNLRYEIVRALRDDWKMSWRDIGILINRDHHFVITVYRRGRVLNFVNPNQ